MDTKRAAKYPFLKESSEFAEKNGADLDMLLTSESYEPARKRGRERVMQALEKTEVSYVDLMNDYDRLIEVMSYPYARMLVSQVGDRFLTKRYALSEAVRMNSLLSKEDRATVVMVSEELGINSTVDHDGTIHIKFPDFLRLASRINSPDWKLINSDIHHGIVYLPQEKYSRLMQNALQDKIESELPLMTPDDYKKYLTSDVESIKNALNDAKMRMSVTNGEGMKIDYLPPCLTRILEMSRAGLNLPHSARFAIVTFLKALGLGYEDIIKVFAESPDFDESKSEYQIKHIMGELSGGDGYSPPECKTMKTNGLCYNPDKICEYEWMTHPLKYYRFKARPRKDNSAPPKEEEQQS